MRFPQWCFSVIFLFLAAAQVSPRKIVCFYDSSSFHREESGKFSLNDLENSLNVCTHIVYGYAKLDENNFTIDALDPDLDLETGRGNYKAVTSLKKRFPGLHILLSIGGWADKEGKEDKYLILLKDAKKRSDFVISVKEIIEKYGFDGIDLAWQFPLVRVKHRSKLSSIWHKIKKTFGYSKSSKDEDAHEHKAGFTALIKQLKLALTPDGHLVTASVLPHSNYSVYYDPLEISLLVDGIHLFAFDFFTADHKITPEVADYPAPLYSTHDRHRELSVNSMVSWFINNSMPANKLILGIPAYGRTWRLTAESDVNGVPPVEANGMGAEGHLTRTKGILSYPEICSLLQISTNFGVKGVLKKVTDPTKKLGTYAYRSDDSEREGIWVGYEDPEMIATKAAYARDKGLGGVALVDISMDDFRGICSGDKYPLLKAAKRAF